MPEAPRPIDRYQFTPSDRLLLDANIWLFIYSPQYRPTDRRAKVYSTALKCMLEARSTILIDAMVLSEFVNVLARLAYNSLPAAQRLSDFKAFRRSSSFKDDSREHRGFVRTYPSGCHANRERLYLM